MEGRLAVRPLGTLYVGFQPSSRALAKASMMRSTWSPVSKLGFLITQYTGQAFPASGWVDGMRISVPGGYISGLLAL